MKVGPVLRFRIPHARVIVAVFSAGMLVCGTLFVWHFTSLPTNMADYVWRDSHMPQLALLLDRDDASLAMDIGNAYFGTVIVGRSKETFNPGIAAQAFTRALAIDPQTPFAHYALARLAFAKGDFDLALSEISIELKIHPLNQRSLYVRGLIYGYRNAPGDLALAEADFRAFTTWSPTEWAGYNDLAWILAKEGKYSEVEDVIQSAFAKVPAGKTNPWLWNELGVALLNTGDYARAHTAFENALTYANQLTEGEWRAAYTGNSPQDASTGLVAFRSGIEQNLSVSSRQRN